MQLPEGVKNGLATYWARLKDGVPVVLFYLCFFPVVVGFFGLRYAIVVSVFNTMFNIRRRKRYAPMDSVKILLWGLACCGFSYLASLHLAWCIALNCLVPFLIVLLRTSQMNPKGYFAYAMMFVFLEIRPPELRTLPVMMAVVLLGTAFLTAALLIYAGFFRHRGDPVASLHRTLPKLADLLEEVARGKPDRACREEIERMQQRIIQASYTYHKAFTYPRRRLRLNDMIATLYQRLGYLAEDDDWRADAAPEQLELLREMAAFLREMDLGVLLEEYDPLIRKCQGILDGMDLPEGRLRIFCRSFLRMLLLILKTVSQPEKKKRVWRFGYPKLLYLYLRRYYTFQSFEMRFALRMSIVLTVSCAASFLLDTPNSFWLPLNAFLMLQPDYEESRHRMLTRPLGTAVGCVVVYFLSPVLPGTWGKLIFSVVMLSLLYCETPGSWRQAICSSSYALTLASMALGERVAIQLLLGYLAGAVALVFLVNRFVLPSRRETLFYNNIDELQRLLARYCGVIRHSLYGQGMFFSSSEILACFHMVYQQAKAYIRASDGAMDRELWRRLMLTLWHMCSELEELAYLVHVGAVREEEYEAFLAQLDAIQRHIRDGAQDVPTVAYAEPDVTYVVDQYVKSARKLLELKEKVGLCPGKEVRT